MKCIKDLQMLTLWYEVTLITIKRDYATVDNIFVMVPMYKETFVTLYFWLNMAISNLHQICTVMIHISTCKQFQCTANKYALKKLFTKSKEKLNHLSWQPKKYTTKRQRASITSFPPTFYSNQVDLCFKNITSVDTGSDWMLSFIVKFNLSSKISDFF